MPHYLLNSAVITAPGVYRYRLIEEPEARLFTNVCQPISAIGYEQTAEALSIILRHPVTVNRIQIVMQPGEEALVFRLALPPGAPRIDPGDKGRLEQVLLDRQFEIGILTRLE